MTNLGLGFEEHVGYDLGFGGGRSEILGSHGGHQRGVVVLWVDLGSWGRGQQLVVGLGIEICGVVYLSLIFLDLRSLEIYVWI